MRLLIIGNAMRWDCKEFSHRCKENHYGKTVCLNVWHTWLCGIRVKIAALRFDKMRRRYLKLTPRCYSMEELESLQADVFMTGSDQVWGPLLDGGYDEAYFLSFVKEGIRKVSYAGSFGRTEFSDIIIASYKRLLSKYDALTVRESSAVKLLEEWGLTVEDKYWILLYCLTPVSGVGILKKM